MIYLPSYIVPSFRYDLVIASFVLRVIGRFIDFFAFGLLNLGHWFMKTSSNVDYYRYITLNKEDW